jgi:hypothetical protein
MAVDLTFPEQKQATPSTASFWTFSQTSEAKQKRRETNAFNRELLLEDILSLYRRGAVPLTIATMVNRSEGFVLGVLRDAGEHVPRWLRNDLEGYALGRHDGNEVPSL